MNRFPIDTDFLEIRLASSGSSDGTDADVVFSWVTSGEPRELWRGSARALGIAPRLSHYSMEPGTSESSIERFDPFLELPEECTETLRLGVPFLDDRDPSIWFQTVPACSPLDMVAWNRVLLAPFSWNRNVRRIPYQSIRPVTFDVPTRCEVLLLRPDTLPATSHFFRGVRDEVQEWNLYTQYPRLRFPSVLDSTHEVVQSIDSQPVPTSRLKHETQDSQQGGLLSPWLVWAAAELGQQTVDCLIVFCDVSLDTESAMLKFVFPTREGRPISCSYVTASEFSYFLALSGATSLILCPVSFRSIGPASLFAADLATRTLSRILITNWPSFHSRFRYRDLFRDLYYLLEQSRLDALFENRYGDTFNFWTRESSDESNRSAEESYWLRTYTLATEQLQSQLSREDAPRWLLAVQRIFELSAASAWWQSELNSGPETNLHPTEQGARVAELNRRWNEGVLKGLKDAAEAVRKAITDTTDRGRGSAPAVH